MKRQVVVIRHVIKKRTLCVAATLMLMLVASVAYTEANETSTPVVDDKIGSWRVVCQAGSCNVYQYGRGGSRPTILRLMSGIERAPEIVIEGGPFTPSGEVRFTVDGEWVTGGLVSTMSAHEDDNLVLPPDDITHGLARRMEKGKTLELTVPRGQEVETIEFDLDGFGEALRRITSP